MVLILVIVGCAVCDTAALNSATTGAEAEAACELPEDLTATWSCTTPLPASTDDIGGLEQIHAQCGLDPLGESEAFATSTGDPLRAAIFYAWATEHRVPQEQASAAAGLIAGEPYFHGQLPRVSSAEPVDLQPAGDLAEMLEALGVRSEGGAWLGWGRYPGYHADLEGQAFVVDASATLTDLRYVVASRASATEPVWFTVISESGLTQVPVYAPGEHRLVSPQTDMSVNDFLADAATEPLAMDLSVSPCGTAPEGMICVNSEDGVLRSEHLQPLGYTYYVDLAPTPVGSEAVSACRDAGACRSAKGSWEADREYCSWSGKRMLTPDEWLWANTRMDDVGEEWTSTQHLFPMGGLGIGHLREFRSGVKKLLNGSGGDGLTGEGKWGAESLAKRSTVVRCAADHPWVNTFPPAGVTDPLPERGLPPEPDPELLARAHDIQQDVLDDKGICGEDVRENWRESLQKGGRSTVTCRDPFSYVTPNEPRRYTFGPYIQDLGGGYVGVGSDQSYDFIAEAKSEWAWVFDYDPNVVRLHEVLQVLIPAAEDRHDFVALFTEKGAKRSRELIEDKVLEAFYNGYRPRLYNHYKRSLEPREEQAPADFGWLSNDEDFTYIQTMIRQGRLVPIGADMLKNESLVNVGKAARDMGIPIRIYYTSNAPTAWGGQAPPEYKGNVLALPMDAQSVVLATFNTGAFGQEGYWHQNISWGPLVQQRYAFPNVVGNYKYVWDRIPTDDGDVTIVGLPSTHPPGTGKKAGSGPPPVESP